MGPSNLLPWGDVELRLLAQQDSAQVVDSLGGFVPESPLPGGISDVVRILFSLPQGIQIAAFTIGVIVATIGGRRLWIHRDIIVRWFQTRSKNVLVAMGVAAALGLLGAAAFGMVSWNYMQHDNDFCSACHVMAGPFTRFDESEHSQLNCHDCHQQSIVASMRQLYLWVTERPMEIAEHSPVPNAVCEACHVTDEHEHWQQVQLTAGHRTHFESDSTALDSLMCVTCHGQEVHRFVPVNETCGQSGCHDNQVITLASMEDQTSLHCAACHRFVTQVPALATTDSARGTTVPMLEQCNSCHEMQAALGDFDPAVEPHGGQCGTCHNPHTQLVAAEVALTCSQSGCHDDWESRPFHMGQSHLLVDGRCTVCHEPHAARVDPSNCEGCHTKVMQNESVPETIRNRLRRALPFDTTNALRSGVLRPRAPAPGRSTSRGVRFRPVFWGIGAPIEAQPPWLALEFLQATPQDSFPHDRHTDLTCLNCHTTAGGHGSLTFEAPRGCQICHHQASGDSDCAACHRADEVNRPVAVTVSVTIEDSTTRRHQVDLVHDIHTTPVCVDCHTEQVTLSAPPSVATCAECHADHHVATRACVTCHESSQVTEAHAPPVDAHVQCDACHDPSTVASLTPDRSFCLTCHQPKRVEHHEATGKECTTCHFLADPEEFRLRLSGSGASR